MRSILAFVIFLFCGQAFAQVASFNLTCDATSGGSVTIAAMNNTPAGQSDEVWALTVQNSAGPLINATSVCGTTVPTVAPCTVYREGDASLVTHFYVACANPADGYDTRGAPHKVAEASLTLDSTRDHGFFYCTQTKTERIEFNNCH